MTIRVGVLGARGRMGSEVCRVVGEADDLELVATVDEGDPIRSLPRPVLNVCGQGHPTDRVVDLVAPRRPAVA